MKKVVFFILKIPMILIFCELQRFMSNVYINIV